MLSPHNEVPFWETFSGVADGLIDCQFADDLQPESSHALNKPLKFDKVPTPFGSEVVDLSSL